MNRSNQTSRVFGAIVFVIAMAFHIAHAYADANAKVIYLSHQNSNDPSGNATAAAAVAFKQRIDTLSNGNIRVEIFPNGQLGNGRNTLKLVDQGIIQSAIVSVGSVSQIYPLIGVLDFPFAWRELEETYAVFDGPFGKAFADDFFNKTGQRVLGFLDSGGFFLLSNNKRVVRTPDDMAGLRIRTMGLDSHKEFVRSVGGEPVAIPWNGLVSAIENGLADGQMNPASIIQFARLDDVQRYLTETNHIYTPYIWVMNEQFFAGLDSENRQIVYRAARAAIEASRSFAKNQSSQALRNLAGRMDVYRPSTDELAAFRDLSQPVLRTHIATTLGGEGTAMLENFLNAIALARKKLGSQ